MTNEQLVIRIKAGIDVPENTLLLWQNNKGYIFRIANKYKSYGELEDLEQEGFLGLCDAIEYYDPEEGVPFMSYAGYWIHQKISRYVKGSSLIRMPEYAAIRLGQYKKMLIHWKKEFNREPTDKEVMRYLNISHQQVEHVKMDLLTSQTGSLDVPMGEDDATMYELLPGDSFEDGLVDKLHHEQLKDTLWSLVGELPGQQSLAIRERFRNELTYEGVGDVLGVSRDAARNLITKGLKELRKPKRSNQLRPFLDEEIYSRALQGNGVNTFRQTWTSSTERVALKLVK